MNNSGRSWEQFVDFCVRLEMDYPAGRKNLRRQWTALWDLVGEEVRPKVSSSEVNLLLGKGYDHLDPEEGDLKALVAYAAGRGLIEPERLHSAIAADNLESPLYFLAKLSGKTFGESITPKVCRFWMMDEGDKWNKRPATDLYDILWTPHEKEVGLRMELKASTEAPAYRFQQIRDPRVGGGVNGDYDALLCIGVTANTLAFWVIPMDVVVEYIDREIIVPQHGGRKKALDTSAGRPYWVQLTPENRRHFRNWETTPQSLRGFAVSLS